jgi:hypothetical protein
MKSAVVKSPGVKEKREGGNSDLPEQEVDEQMIGDF